jgi:adenylate cyclase
LPRASRRRLTALADFVEGNFDLERVGEYPVRGFNDPIELFAYNG